MAEYDTLLEKRKCNCYVVFVSSIASLGFALYGYDIGIMSGALLSIKEYFQLSAIWQGIIVSSTIGTAALSSLIAGILADKVGRKRIIALASFVFTVGTIIKSTPKHDEKEILLLGRVTVGLSIGMLLIFYIREVKQMSVYAYGNVCCYTHAYTHFRFLLFVV